MFAGATAEECRECSLGQRARRLLAAVALCRIRLRASWLLWMARAQGGVVALAYAGLILLLPDRGASGLDSGLMRAALGWLAWVAGLAALGTARDQQRRDREDGIPDLLELRGLPGHRLEAGRVLAAAESVALTALVPGVALAALALAMSPTLLAAAERGLLAVRVVVFSLVLGVILGPLARWCAVTFPGRGRGAFLIVTLAPEVLRQAWPATPSVPALLADVYAVILGAGGGP